MATVEIAIGPARAQQAQALAKLHADTWRLAYRGIIPHLALEKMIAGRGPRWWQKKLNAGEQMLVAEFDEVLAGYVYFGANRASALGFGGEIFELYMQPEYQGVGLGEKLFDAARRHLKKTYARGFLVWALAENDGACAFYRAMGGKKICEAVTIYDNRKLSKIGFGWR